MLQYAILHEHNIENICVKVSLSQSLFLEIVLTPFGAGLREISVVDKSNTRFPLTLSYQDMRDAMSNPSLAGLTVGPNAGRLPGNVPLTLQDSASAIHVCLPANENSNQIHGGRDNLSSRIWDLEDIQTESNHKLTVVFKTALPNGHEGWPGERVFFVKYSISEDGALAIEMRATTDRPTYINMTNHAYWLRDLSTIRLNASRMIENYADFLPKEIVPLQQFTTGFYAIEKETAYNNGFLLNASSDSTALCHAATIDFVRPAVHVDLYTDAPSVVVYTGDYLDESTRLVDDTLSFPGCAVALEPQELFPYTKTTLAAPGKAFERKIVYTFSTL